SLHAPGAAHREIARHETPTRWRSPSPRSRTSPAEGSSSTPAVTCTRRCYHSPEPTGDVTLGARVGRIGEHLLGRVVLDQSSRAAALVVDVGRHERCHVGDARGLL